MVFAQSVRAQIVEVILEPVVEHTGTTSDGVDLTGFTTYRMYAVLSNENDFVSSVFGLEEAPLTITTTTSFFNAPLGGAIASNVNPLIVENFESVAYDTWVTIGRESSGDPGNDVTAVETPAEPWFTTFSNGGNIVIDGTFGGAWFTLFGVTAVNGFAGDDLRVLIGQFTTDGEISATVNIQVFIDGMQANDVNYLNQVVTVVQPTTPGCTNAAACNYDASATEDDGSCILEGDACDDSDANTVNDAIQSDCTCAGDAIVTGCTDMMACNFNMAANTDDGSCLFVGDACDDGDGSTVNDSIQEDCTCAGVVPAGCTDMAACNFDPAAGTDDGSCEYLSCCEATAGTLTIGTVDCVQEGGNASANQGTAPNVPMGYQVSYVLTQGPELVLVTLSDTPEFSGLAGGSYTIHTFVYPEGLDLSFVELGVTTGFEVNALLAQGGGTLCAALDVAGAPFIMADCEAVLGCTDMMACNFNAEATQDDGSCILPGDSCDDGDATTVNDTVQEDCTCAGETVPGCTDMMACNYDMSATVDDGSCILPGDACDDGNAMTENDTVQSDCSCAGTLIPVPGCTDMAACNFNEMANEDDGSCEYLSCCEADAGSIAIDTVGCLPDNATASATVVTAPNVPMGYVVSYVLTQGAELVIVDLSATPSFSGISAGVHTIHTFVYPENLDLSIVEFGVTTGFDVNALLAQGGGTVCAALDVAGAGFVMAGCDDVLGCTDMMACNFNADATVDDGSCVLPGDSCDDGDETTVNDTVQEDCSCAGETVPGCTDMMACNYDMTATVDDGSCFFPGDACDDNDANTINDTVQPDCSCSGEAVVEGCTDDMACNYDMNANTDDGSCFFVGDACDDGDANTVNDTITENCACEGTVGIDEALLAAVQVFPNPASNEVVIDLGQSFTPVMATLTDVSGRIVMSQQITGRGVLRVDAVASGMYVLMLETTDARSEVRVMVQH